MGKPRTEQSGLTYSDVLRLMQEIEDTYYGRTVLELSVSVGRAGQRYPRLTIVAANYVGLHRTARNTRASVQIAFPSNRHKTIAGAQVWALYELITELDAVQAKERAADSVGKQPLFDLS